MTSAFRNVYQPVQILVNYEEILTEEEFQHIKQDLIRKVSRT